MKNAVNQAINKIELHLEGNMHTMNKLGAVIAILDILGIENEELTTIDSLMLYDGIKKGLLQAMEHRRIEGANPDYTLIRGKSIAERISLEDRSRFVGIEVKITKY